MWVMSCFGFCGFWSLNASFICIEAKCQLEGVVSMCTSAALYVGMALLHLEWHVTLL